MSLKALDEAMLEDELVFLTSQKEAEVDEPTADDFYHVGTICRVKQVIKLPGDTVRVLVEGISRGKVKEISQRNDKRLFEELLWKSHTKAAEKRLQPIASVLRNDLLHGGYGAFDHAVVRLFC